MGIFLSLGAGPAEPSATDLRMAYETNLIWVIVAVAEGKVTDIRAHGVDDDRNAFHPIPLSPTG